MKKNLRLFLLMSMMTLLLAGCNDDDAIDFGTAPPATLMTTGAVKVITEDTVRYHVVTFPRGGSTATIIESKTGLVFVDVGFLPNSGKELRAYADTISKPISIILTHLHGDHFGNIIHFTDAKVYASSAVATALMADTKGFAAAYPNTVTAVKTSQTIAGLTVNFGTISAAETQQNGYIALPELKALFTGDLAYYQGHPYIREYTPLDATDELSNWMNGLTKLKTEYGNYRHIFAGHNGNSTQVSTVLEDNMNYLKQAQGLIKGTKLLGSGAAAKTNKEVTDELARLYPKYAPSSLLLSLPNAFFAGDPGAQWFK